VRRASRERRDLRRQELRQAILDAAADLFLAEGYERFSMRQVAERIGYSATTIYRHFADKDELLFAVVDQGFERFGAALDEASRSTDDPIGRIRALGRAYVRFGRENAVYYQMMFMQRADYLNAPVGESTESRVDSFSVLERAVQSALDAGALRPGDARKISSTLWALVHGITALAITMTNKEMFAAEADVDAALAAIFEGLRAR
jgi:AcrR family transcriptional regulator